jgi:hypothetical protein
VTLLLTSASETRHPGTFRLPRDANNGWEQGCCPGRTTFLASKPKRQHHEHPHERHPQRHRRGTLLALAAPIDQSRSGRAIAPSSTAEQQRSVPDDACNYDRPKLDDGSAGILHERVLAGTFEGCGTVGTAGKSSSVRRDRCAARKHACKRPMVVGTSKRTRPTDQSR